MEDFPNLPRRRLISLADFVADLRSLIFKTKTEAAKHFDLSLATVSRYENVSDSLQAPLGYLASLAVIVVSLQRDDLANNLGNSEYILKQINQIIRAEYEEVPFKSWDELLKAANVYMGMHVPNTPDYVRDQVNLFLEVALIPEIKNNYQRSTEFIIRGLDLAKKSRYKIGVIDALDTKASLCLFHNQFIEAKTAYQEALDLAISLNERGRINKIGKQQELLNEFMNKRVFISYNHADKNFVRKLAKNLQEAGLSVWWDEWEIKVGDSIVEKVSSGIKAAANLVVILSPSSVSSPWVQREVGSALMKQLSSEKGVTILPVLVADCEIPMLLRDIRYADLRKSYKSGLAELLEVLKVSYSAIVT